jgi:hypothetical protein
VNLRKIWNTSLPFEFEVDASFEDCLAMLEAYRSAKPDFWARKFSFAIPIVGTGFCTVESHFSGVHLDAQLEGDGAKTLISGYADYHWPRLLVIAILCFVIAGVNGFQHGFHWSLSLFGLPLLLDWFLVTINRQTLLGEFQKIFAQAKRS